MKIPVGISSCLLGENVRYDGGNKQNDFIQQILGTCFEFKPFCPEIAIGLGVPRTPIRLQRSRSRSETRCVSVSATGQDFTEDLIDIADQRALWHKDLCGYILKRSSPSCGMEGVKVYDDRGVISNDGSGIYAASLMKNHPDLPVEDEGRLADLQVCENFVQRVFVTWRWKGLLQGDLTVSKIKEFHARHTLTLMSHSRVDYETLGRLVTSINDDNMETLLPQYLHSIMSTLKKIATVDSHVNVLSHIQGYLGKDLKQSNKQAVQKCIEDFRIGLVSLDAPISLLNHYFRAAPSEYIANSWYMNPCPVEWRVTQAIRN